MKSGEGLSEKSDFNIIKESTKLTESIKNNAGNLIKELRQKSLNINKRNDLASRSPGWKANREIALAQASLAMAGYNLGPFGIDGRLGPDTTKIIRRFQNGISLKNTGQLDIKTKAALDMVTEEGISFRQIEMPTDALSNKSNKDKIKRIAYKTELITAKDYKNFWANAAYFTNNWILDKIKRDAAVVALKTEIAAKGKIILPNETNPNKITAIQYLGGIMDTGEYGPDTYDKIQTIQTKYSIKGDPKVIDSRTFNVILERFNNGLIGQKSGDFLKRSGGLAYAPYDVAYGLLGGKSLFEKNRVNLKEEPQLKSVLNGADKREIIKNGAYYSEYNSFAKGLGRLEGKSINVTQKGLDMIVKHLSKFGETTENQAMVKRLETALKEGKSINGADASFYLHEATEATLMSKNMSYDLAHAASLKKYQVSQYSVYAPEVIKNNPELFNEKWFEFWGIK